MADTANTKPSHGAPHIVVGVDGSPESVLALRWANQLATTFNAQIRAVNAWHYEHAFGPYSPSEWDPDADAHQILRRALADAFGDQVPSNITIETVRGRPASVLLRAAEHAKLLLVGSRGHGGFAGMLLGSVSSACAEHAQCPVLVVHSKTDESVGAPL